VTKDPQEAAIEGFQNGASRGFLISLKAAGLGWNLDGRRHGDHFRSWWNPACRAAGD